MHYGYAQALRARTQQAVQRPIRARQSLDEWTKALAARANEAANDPRPALNVLVLGLAARSLLAEDRPTLAFEVAERGQEIAAAALFGDVGGVGRDARPGRSVHGAGSSRRGDSHA